MFNYLRLRQLKYDEQMAAFKDDVDELHRVAEGKNEVYRGKKYDEGNYTRIAANLCFVTCV